MYYCLMDWNCSIPGCEAAPVALSLTPIKAGPGQWVISGTLDAIKAEVAAEHPLALKELETYIEEVFEVVFIKGYSVEAYLCQDGSWSSWCMDDISGMLSVSNMSSKEDLIDFLMMVPGF